MLKRIAVTQVVIGMYIDKLCGSWLDHPFWKCRFLVRSESELQRLRRSAVTQVWIDTNKGLDVPDIPPAAAQANEEPPAPPLEQCEPAAPQRVSLAEETQRARQICCASKTAIAEMFNDARMGKAVRAEHAVALVEEISDSIHRHPHALINLARLKTADEYTYMHSVAVCALMVALARQLGLSEVQVRTAGIAGLLHDIGKMAIPDAILNKAGRLTDEELRIVREHPQSGFSMLLESGQVEPEVLDVVLHHHEKVDGTGYPHRLAGQGISLLARMGAVCDVYDAITSNRAYKRAWDPAESIHRMAQWKGHFDEELLQAFVRTIGIYPIGALVRLESGRIGVVLEQHPSSLLTPRVKVFYSARLRQPIPQQIIDLEALAGQDQIVCREPAEHYGNLDALGPDFVARSTDAHT